METRYFYLLRLTIALGDLVLLNVAFFVSIMLSGKYVMNFDQDVYRHNVIMCNVIWLVSASVFGLYSENTLHKLESVYKATWRSTVSHAFLMLAYLFFSNSLNYPKYLFICFYGLLIFGFLASRFIGTAFRAVLHKNFHLRKAVAVLGMNSGGIKLAAYLEQQSSLNFVGFLKDGYSSVNEAGELIAVTPAQQIRSAVESGADEVFVCMDTDKMGEMTELIKEGEKQCVRLKFVPNFTELEGNMKFDKRGNFLVLYARNEPLETIENRFKKRLFDIIVSLGVIVFIFSWLYPILALIIKIQSPGPVIFKQQRSGRDNKTFWCYKFRSMYQTNQNQQEQARVNDARVTPIGKFMRKTSIDELPQFFNVLLGYMSIIGPRPHMLSHTQQYSKIIDKYMVRQFLKPGISGWAQINGYRGETKNNLLMQKRVEHDIWYMENWSLMLDVKIMFLTIINIFKGEENAY
ncbi:undecaprenyl-phosphate glucose phosphotransferase [Mucilaginibacter phyllosphaerae]|uniref:Undecaprenyl-phosphate glucose phosphotransferase n=1 Tax=Mucilaginibacter phyllosphaerae TaxID=1812349 RepID=A0A4Y8A9L6_9SPHI|nr:undecaprenyl-phosphate glucose phosphotransferase [Mucilaginibacter phyllosphaerae]MBB3970506.1 Undecaprenyl-phosphate glucose phosphotransferase [Mucilaginibacter phyllosphaerae]TEW64521.1 undecaprenyl-phosphate glucose phosphotransferase [Mucilaginibacter phyllosphaerae]GGH19201.1 undecaprenyl-phosphate glucose phosphotransferase [Mucilaginibacter phyllosphaerae]